MSTKKDLCEFFDVLTGECKDLVHSHAVVPVIDQIDSKWPIKFYKDYVSKNIPVLIKNGCKHFQAVKKWNATYFRDKLGQKEVTVAITPNGYADALLDWTNNMNESETVFAMPEERIMRMEEFLDSLDQPIDNFVCYIQQQNSNLTNQLKELTCDIEMEVKWASEAFDNKPDAINFWMGDSRAITSMHKDPYENIFCVIDGYKDFILIPPTDLPYVPYRTYKSVRFNNITEHKFDVEPVTNESGENLTVPWIAIDPLMPNYEKYKEFKNVSMYQIRVHKGDCLYLPSLWFHHVRQSHRCISVNYWYDMDFDIKYCYYKMLEAMCLGKD